MLGGKIRTIRRALGLTLEQVGTQAGISAGSLSQIERGIVDPSLSTLRGIAQVLQVPPYYLLIESVMDAFIVRKAERGRLGGADANIELITSGTQPLFEMLSITLGPGESLGGAAVYQEGESHVVIQGSVRVQVGDQLYELGEGDTIYIPAGLPHNVQNVDETVAVLITAVEKLPAR
jgi:transcriptional regulator with XRE-family HTH domain